MKKTVFVLGCLILAGATAFAAGGNRKVSLKELSFNCPKDYGCAFVDDDNINSWNLNVKESTTEDFYSDLQKDERFSSLDANKIKNSKDLVNLIKANDFDFAALGMWISHNDYQQIKVKGKNKGTWATLSFSECGDAENKFYNKAYVVTDKYVYELSVSYNKPAYTIFEGENSYVEYDENGGRGPAWYWKENEAGDRVKTMISFFNDMKNLKADLPENVLKFQSAWNQLISSIKIK